MIFQFVIGNDVIEQHKAYNQSDAVGLEYKTRQFEKKHNVKQKGTLRMTKNLVVVLFQETEDEA